MGRSAMFMPKPGALMAALAVVVLSQTARAADAVKVPHLGTPMTADDIAKWDLTIFPDGRGLPEGKGTTAEGKVIFDKQCATCHGAAGRGGTAEELVSEPGHLSEEAASKAIGPYWPFATTVFDFIRRSMPPSAPGTLTPDQLYSVTAYLLAANKVIPENSELDARTLAAVKMPNRDGFDWIDVKK
jgi:mono/diheme cytochrome c family protein